MARAGIPLAIALAVAAVCGLPALQSGFDLDSVNQLNYLEGARRVDLDLRPPGLWRFSTGTQQELEAIRAGVAGGTQPWCVQTQRPWDRMIFLRPLPSALLTVEHSLWGVHPLPYQIHTLLWSLLLIAMAGLLYLRLLPPAPGAGWSPTLAAGATLLFAIDATHAHVLAGTSLRHLPMAAVFGVGSLLAHVAWRQRAWRPGAWLAPALFAVGLGCSENGLQILGYWIAYALLVRSESWDARLRSLLPVLAIAAIYVVGYAAAGYGARGNGYIDVLQQPLVLMREAPVRLADLLLEELALAALLGGDRGPFSGLSRLRAPEAARILIAAAALLALAGWLRVSVRRAPVDGRRTVVWLSVGALLSVAPVLVGQPGPRGLLLPSLGVAAVFAFLVRDAWRIVRDGRRPFLQRALWALPALAILAVRGVASPVALYTDLLAYRDHTRAIYERWQPAQVVDASLWERPEWRPDPMPTDVVVLAAPSVMVPNDIRPELRTLVEGDRPVARPPGQRWWYLANNVLDFSYVFARTGEDRFTLSLGRPKRHPTWSRNLWITCGGYRGMAARTRSLDIRVTRVGPIGTIAGIEVVADRSLDDPSLVFATWRDGALRSVSVPRVGGRLRLE